MNRNEKRNLRKDKDLVKYLYSIINKFFPKLLNMFKNLTDTRSKLWKWLKQKEFA